MAKRHKRGSAPAAPSTNTTEQLDDEQLDEPEDDFEQLEVEQLETAEQLGEMAGLNVPLADPQPGSHIEQQTGRFDLRLNRKTELPGFRRLHAGLLAGGYKLADGRPVEYSADAIRWICEQLTELQGLTED